VTDYLKLTTYFGERRRSGDRFLADALFEIYGRHAVRTSVLLRGIEGFGARHHLRTDTVLTLSEDLPLVSVAVDAPSRIEGLLDEVDGLRRHGLVTLERARAAPADTAGEMKLTLYVGRREPTAAICAALRRHGVAGATVLLGVDGTVDGVRRRARFFARNAEVPTMVIAVGAGERIAAALPELGDWPRTIERVRVCKRDGRVLAEPGQDGPLQKLTVFGSEHVDLVRRLRATGARGVTCVRGIWGFHGDHAPHGDRLLQLRRRAGVVTELVDSPERIARSFAVVDEATRERGLVTSELVPRELALSDPRPEA
jgi:PII-like signaling protein